MSLPPPRKEIPESKSWVRDFTFLLATQLRIFWNTARRWGVWTWVLTILLGLALMGSFVGLGTLVEGSLRQAYASLAGGLLSLIFLMGLAMQLFTGITTAFSTLYLSPDLTILFTTPVATRAIFAMKSLQIALATALFVLLLDLMPAILYGLVFSLAPGYYLVMVLVVLGLWTLGTALSELFDLAAMRLIPPHRAREAMGVIGGLAGLLVAALLQLPYLLMVNERVNLAAWLTGQQEALRFMAYTPMGWAAGALTAATDSSWGAALGWALLLVATSTLLYLLAGLLLERGFRQGWLAVAQASGGRARRRSASLPDAVQAPAAPIRRDGLLAPGTARENASVWPAIWAIAHKDLLSFRRDMREWMNILLPLVVLGMFIAIELFNPNAATRTSLLTIIVLYGVMMGGQMALQSFGREGEAPWVLNSVPTFGWPVVWGKLLAAVLPSLLLMEAMLLLISLPLGLPADLIGWVALAVVFLTLGASSTSLYGSLRYARFNPDTPQQRISGSGTMLMFLINLVFTAVLGYGVAVALLPGEYLGFLALLGAPPFPGGIAGLFERLLYYPSSPFTWELAARRAFGLPFSLLIWALVFFGFLALTAKQAARGIEVAAVSTAGKQRRRP